MGHRSCKTFVVPLPATLGHQEDSVNVASYVYPWEICSRMRRARSNTFSLYTLLSRNYEISKHIPDYGEILRPCVSHFRCCVADAISRAAYSPAAIIRSFLIVRSTTQFLILKHKVFCFRDVNNFLEAMRFVKLLYIGSINIWKMMCRYMYIS